VTFHASKRSCYVLTMPGADVLSSYPYVVVRIACRRCTRKGSYRLARLAAKYGAEIPMMELLAHLAGDCAIWDTRHPGPPRCGAYFVDLDGPAPPPRQAHRGDAAPPPRQRRRLMARGAEKESLRRRCHTNLDRRGAGFGMRADLTPWWRLATSGTLRLLGREACGGM
jgi:hypothetical protein